MRSGIVSPLPPLVPHTDGIASGLLPTPAAREWKDRSLGSILARLDRGDGVAKRICALSEEARSSAGPVILNPSFAEWMMGYPEQWTVSEA